MRRALLVAPAVVLLGALGFGLFRARPLAELGRPAPAFSLPLLQEPRRQLSLRDLAGRPVVLNFWASWCEPCREEAPELARAWREHRATVAFLGVNILDGREEALRYAREFGLQYPSVRDASGRVAKLYGVTGVPETVFIDRDGRVAGKYIGAFTGQLSSLVRRLQALRPGETLDITGRGRSRPVP